MAPVAPSRVWIGTPPTFLQSAAVMLVGTTGIMMAGLQPLLLGALHQQDRLSAADIGPTATVELLAMGIAAGVAGAWLKPVRLPLITAAAALLLALIDILTMNASGGMLLAMRTAAGFPSGVLMWVTGALIARSPLPERWAAAWLTIQTAAQFLWATALTVWVMPRYGADGGFASLAGLCVVTALIGLALPRRYAPLRHAEDEVVSGLPPARGWLALAVSFLYIAFILAVWVYTEPLSAQAGHGPDVFSTAVSLSLGCQVLGGLAATFAAGHVRWFGTLMVCSVVNLGLLAGFAALPGPAAYLVLQGVFGFVWLFVTPFLVPMTVEADPTRRTAVLMGGAQLIGGSAGPLLAAAFVSDADARGALAFGSVCLVMAVMIAAGLHLRRHRIRVAAV